MMPQRDAPAPSTKTDWRAVQGRYPDWCVLDERDEILIDDITEAQARLIAAAPANARLCEELADALEQDRSTVADGIRAITEAIRKREWLRLGRGSYEYDDDRWRDEFSGAIDEIMESLVPLRSVASNWKHCPQDQEHIKKARAALKAAGRAPQ